MELLAVDITQILIVAIPSFFSLVGLIITLLVKGRVETVNTKVDSYKKEVDGMKTELVEAVKGKYQAEGELKGAADQKKEAAAVNIALTALPLPITDKPIDVNIVDQKKPLEVTNKVKK